MVESFIRSKFWFVASLLYLICYGHSIDVAAQKQDLALTYTVQEGLSDNEITCLQQDDWGFWWIGTPNGLNHFDGFQVKRINLHQQTAPNEAIHDLQSLGEHQLAIATGQGVALLDTRTQQYRSWQLPGDNNLKTYRNRIERIVPLPQQRLAVYSLTGVYIFNGEMQVIATLEDPAIQKDSTTRRIHFGLRMDAFRNGDMLIATTNGYRLYHFASNRFAGLNEWSALGYDALARLIAAHSSSYIFDIDQQDRLLFVDNKQPDCDTLFLYDRSRDKVHPLELPFVPRQHIRWDNHFQFFPNGSITLTCSFAGYFHFMIGTDDQWVTSPILADSSFSCRTIGFDAASSYWLIGTEQGLRVQAAQPDLVRQFKLPANAAGNRQLYAAHLAKARLYFSDFNNSGVIFSLAASGDEKSLTAVRLNNTGRRSLVYAIQPFRGDTLMLVSETGLLLLPPGASKAIPLHTAYPRVAPVNQPLIAAAFDGTDILWLAGQEERGLYRVTLSTGATRFFANGPAPASLPLRTAQQIVFDSEGYPWFHHYADGIVRFNTGSQNFDRHLRTLSPENDKSYAIAGVAPADSGTLWAFLNDFGLVRVNPATGSCRRVLSIEDRAGNYCNPLAATPDGWLLIALHKGSYAYHPATGRLQSPPITQGLLPQQLRHTSTSDAPGVLLTGYGNRLSVWHYLPQRLATGAHAYITRVQTGDGRTLNRWQSLQLPYTENALQVEFAANDGRYGWPRQYAYRLQAGEDRADWIPLGSQSFVYLTHLQPGQYRFEVKRLLAAGSEEAGTDSFSFTILQPWYATLWFRALALALIASLVWLLVWYRQKHKRQAEAIRQHISADLHDAIGSRLTNLRFINQMALQQQVSEPATPLLNRMDEELEASSQALHQLVWRMKWKSTRLADLEALIRRDANEILDTDHIAVQFSASIGQSDIRLLADQFHDILLMTRELLTNIRKHAGASTVFITLERVRRQCHIKVTDNGCGFSESRVHGRNGLSILRMRLSKWKGTMTITPAAPQGTITLLQFQLVPASSLKGIARQYLSL